MADTSNLSNYLKDVADAIRVKKETTEQIPAANFDTEILSIETGVDTSDATATVNDIIQGKTAYSSNGKISGAIGTIYSSELSDTYITRNMIDDRPLGGYFITISPDGNYLFFVNGTKLFIYKYSEEAYINTGITHNLDARASSIVNCSALDENNNYYIITSRTSAGSGGQVLKFNINDNTIVLVSMLNSDAYNKNILFYSRDISTKYICSVNTTKTIPNEHNYYNMCISAISDLDSHIVNVNCVAPNNTSNIKAKTVNIINDNCFIMQQIGLIGTDEYVKSTDLTIINSSTNEFIKNTHIEGSFVPNKSLTYAIVDNNIKSIFIDVNTGSYNVLESTSIIIPNYTSSCLVKWLDDFTIICGDYTTGVVNVYDIDIITNTINLIASITTIGGNRDVFDRTFNMFFVGPSFVGDSNGFGNNKAFVKLQEGEQKLISLVRNNITYTNQEITSAIDSDLLRGKTAYSNGKKLSGTMPNNGELHYNSSTEEQTIPAGYTSGGTIAPAPLTDTEYDECLELSEQILGENISL